VRRASVRRSSFLITYPSQQKCVVRHVSRCIALIVPVALALTPSPPTPSLTSLDPIASKPPLGFAEDAVLLALKNPTLMDVRGVEGKGEIAENPSPAGAVNVAWNTAGGEFFDASKLPADKTAPVIVF
tara:strand:- start:495 stop:878 length:384 start_codon:yes stop_codon:yes gene_type:complete